MAAAARAGAWPSHAGAHKGASMQFDGFGGSLLGGGFGAPPAATGVPPAVGVPRASFEPPARAAPGASAAASGRNPFAGGSGGGGGAATGAPGGSRPSGRSGGSTNPFGQHPAPPRDAERPAGGNPFKANATPSAQPRPDARPAGPPGPHLQRPSHVASGPPSAHSGVSRPSPAPGGGSRPFPTPGAAGGQPQTPSGASKHSQVTSGMQSSGRAAEHASAGYPAEHRASASGAASLQPTRLHQAGAQQPQRASRSDACPPAPAPGPAGQKPPLPGGRQQESDSQEAGRSGRRPAAPPAAGRAPAEDARRAKSLTPAHSAGASAESAARRTHSRAPSELSDSSDDEAVLRGPRAPVPLDHCSKCRQRISGKFIQAGGREYHAECFSCSSCNRPINGAYITAKDGGPLCQECQPRCHVCKEPLAGSSVIKLEGHKVHAHCFRCSDCKACISGGHFKASPGVYRCSKCHAAAWQAKESRKDAHASFEQRSIKRRNTARFNLEWRGELVPSSLEALSSLGVPPGIRPRGELVCICHDAKSGRVAVAHAPQKVPESAVNISYLACALRVLGEYGREPSFSLDPKDPHQISGETQVKAFYPPWLAKTVVGEVLFQADYVLKEICLGDREMPGLPSAFGELTESGGEKAARQWFVVRQAAVTVAADGTLVPRCQMGVESRCLVQTSEGYKDAPYTDPNEPTVQLSKAMTTQFDTIAKQLPAVAELLQLAKAVIMARYLLQNGCRYDKTVVGGFKLPCCPEGDAYAMEIPTLRNTKQVSVVSEANGQLTMHRSQRSMHGGVDLGIPEKKIPAVKAPQPLLRPDDVRAPLPLFVQPIAAVAA